MIAQVDGWTIVATGSWNRMIFTPEWLQAAGVFPAGQPVAVEVPVNLIGPPRLSFNGINIRVDARKMIIGTDGTSDDRLERMQQLATTVLTQLPHTPVAAIGVNFQWLEADPPGTVLRCFDAADAGALGEADLRIRSGLLKRTLDDAGRTLNLSLHLTEERQVLFDFNFHFDVANATAARDAIASGIIGLRDRALQILGSVYELELVAQ